MKRIAAAAVIIMAVVGGILLIHHRNMKPSVTIDSNKIGVEIANTESSRELGLGNRNSLSAGRGMLLTFDKPGDYGFWMKDMRFNIDIIWISADKKIVTVAADVSPSSYPKAFHSTDLAQYVLEVNAGYAAGHNFKAGDQVKFTGVE